MIDVAKTTKPRSDITNADDLLAGDMTVTITAVREASGEQPIAVYCDRLGDKPFMPCKSMRRVMVAVWGANGEDYVGQSMTLFCDPSVKFGGIEVGGIRIRAMTGLKERKTFNLTVTRSLRKPYVVQPLQLQNAAPQVDPERVANILEDARFAARKGGDGFKDWWTGPGKEDRAHILSHKDDLVATAQAVDAKATAPDDDEPVTNEDF